MDEDAKDAASRVKLMCAIGCRIAKKPIQYVSRRGWDSVISVNMFLYDRSLFPRVEGAYKLGVCYSNLYGKTSLVSESIGNKTALISK